MGLFGSEAKAQSRNQGGIVKQRLRSKGLPVTAAQPRPRLGVGEIDRQRSV